MGFPAASDAFARTFLEKNEHDSLGGLATSINEWVQEKTYGVGEALLQGRYFRYPHEIQKQLNCAEAAVLTYLIANHAGLHPRIFRAVNFNGTNTDHLFIDTLLGSTRVIIDPFFEQCGEVTYHDSHLVIGQETNLGEGLLLSVNLGDEDNEAIKKLTYDSLEEMTEEDIHNEIAYFNSPEGFFYSMRGGQKLFSASRVGGGHEVTSDFCDDAETLTVRINHVDSFLFYFSDELVCSLVDEGIGSVKRRFVLSEKSAWCGYESPVFFAEQTVDLKINDEQLVVKPHGSWRIGDIFVPEEHPKLSAFLSYSIGRELRKRPFLFPTGARQAKFHRRFLQKINDIKEEIARIDEKNSGERIYYRDDLRKRDLDSQFLMSLRHVARWNSFSSEYPREFQRLLDIELFVELYDGCLSNIDNLKTTLAKIIEPGQTIDRRLQRYHAFQYCAVMSRFYKRERETALRSPEVHALFREVSKNAKKL